MIGNSIATALLILLLPSPSTTLLISFPDEKAAQVYLISSRELFFDVRGEVIVIIMAMIIITTTNENLLHPALDFWSFVLLYLSELSILETISTTFSFVSET